MSQANIVSHSLFVDTSGWADPILQNTPLFVTMKQYSQQIITGNRPLLTTSYVFAELVTLLTARSLLTRPRILQFISGLKQLPNLTLVHIDLATDTEAWALLEQFNDKDWSLVDAASFVVMRRYGLIEAFTSDHHFAQAGFLRAPQP